MFTKKNNSHLTDFLFYFINKQVSLKSLTLGDISVGDKFEHVILITFFLIYYHLNQLGKSLLLVHFIR